MLASGLGHVTSAFGTPQAADQDQEGGARGQQSFAATTANGEVAAIPAIGTWPSNCEARPGAGIRSLYKSKNLYHGHGKAPKRSLRFF